MVSLGHLVWLPAGALVGFTAAFVFGDLVTIHVDLYYLIYFSAVLGFLALYVRRTHLDIRVWVSRRLTFGVVAGVVGGVVLMQGVLARPETPHLSGWMLAWTLVWRGLVYGTVDGLLLLTFPWVVVWRAGHADDAGWARRIGAGITAWAAILFMTTSYHLGYTDFRSVKIVQPNIGSTIGAIPTLVSANPVASPVSHVFLHVAAVVHSPDTNLFLPPHRE